MRPHPRLPTIGVHRDLTLRDVDLPCTALFVFRFADHTDRVNLSRETNSQIIPPAPRQPTAGDIDTTDFTYRALAIGGYVLGRSDLSTAAAVSGVPPGVLAEAARAEAGSPGERTGGDQERPLLSIVVPVFNNATTLRELHRRLTDVLVPLGRFELVFVDDGSSDGSAEVLRELNAADPRTRVLRLSRNFGQQAALTAGLNVATGRGAVMMDADLQDPPEVIPDLVERWRAGNEVVYLVRRKRKENPAKRLAYSLFYRTFRYLAEVDVPLDSGEFSLLDRKVVDVLNGMPERSRFLRGLRSWSGFRQTAVEYDRPARPSGDSQYTWRRLVRLAADGLIGFSSGPLRLAAVLGLVTAVAGLVMLAVVLVIRVSAPNLPVGWTSSLAVMLLLGGTQLCTIGMVGAYIARIYAEVKNRPLYIVMERLG